MTGTPELLPCPFCGEPAEFGETQESIHDDGPQFYSCCCSVCSADTPREPTKEEAAEWWNRRTAGACQPVAESAAGPDYKFKFEALVEHCKRQDSVIADLRYNENIRRYYDDGAVWFWNGDETDNLDTLACPVVINAGDLRALLSKGSVAHE